MPSGHLALLTGFGDGAPFLFSFFLMGMFLALLLVPQGGPKCTLSTRPDLIIKNHLLNPLLSQIKLDSCRLQTIANDMMVYSHCSSTCSFELCTNSCRSTKQLKEKKSLALKSFLIVAGLSCNSSTEATTTCLRSHKGGSFPINDHRRT